MAKVVVTDTMLNTITNLSRLGFTQFYIANVLGVPTSTLSDWKRKNPLVADALSIGTDGLLSDVKSKLTETALSGSSASAVSAGQFLLNKYEGSDTPTTVAGVTDDDIRDEILSELNDK